MKPLLKLFFSILLIIPINRSFSQSIHQSELELYNSKGNASAEFYDTLTASKKPLTEKVICNLNKKVYGWHPYWIGSAYQNYQWDLLSHLSFFSFEVNYLNGNAVSTHGWSTSAAVNAALATGSTKVTLCVTLFANHASFLTNATAKQALITNLIALISARGAHGVNIDFEGLPASQSTNFANFMVDLANQFHAAIPGSEVSTVLYSVDWSSIFNFQIMEPEVDNYIIMGYDYYYSGSSTAGPNDPLYQFGTSYNYTLSRSITDYVKAGCPKDKLILGLPNYGREWSTASLAIPSSTTATGVSRTYSYIRNNSTGFYSNTNHFYDNDSQSDEYLFMNAGTPKQCYITKEIAFSQRLQHVLNSGIGGIGIWALGYDDGYTELWDAINSKMTDCYVDSCSGNIHDFGGTTKNYYNNEEYTWTISPPNATSLDVNFSLFDVESNYDYLYVYDGNSIAATQIAGSPFTGTTSPGVFTTSSGAITFRFTSDLSTTRPGFIASYTCNQDYVAPTTSISTIGNWQTTDFNVNYIDSDNSSVQQAFSLITDFDGSQRTGNRTLGYLFEDFSATLTNQWSTGLGAWNINAGKLNQSTTTETNSACYSTVSQTNSSEYVYHWKGTIGGAGTNRRAGLHFFCSDPLLPNRGNSYLVYWRADTDKCQIYRSTADNLVLQTNDDIVFDPNSEYDFKITYNPSTGTVNAYLNNLLVSTWIDPSPITNGNAISFRSGECSYIIDDVKIFKSRLNSELVSIGSAGSMVRYQNPNSVTPSCGIYSLVIDNAANFSSVSSSFVNSDWTVPTSVSVNDGLGADINVFVTSNEISTNWTSSLDPNSDISSYLFAVGTSSGSQDVASFTNVGLSTNFTLTGLSLVYGQMYYITVKSINGAGLESLLISSDGQLLQIPTTPPIANFYIDQLTVCEGDSVLLNNTSIDGVSFSWSTTNGTINNPTSQQTYLIPTTSGSCLVTLIATNSAGSNQSDQTYSFNVLSGPIASATPDLTNLELPNAIVLFNNTSQNADNYFWDFGDGDFSVDQNPWHEYTSIGTFTVMLIATRTGCLNDTTYFTINVGQAFVIENENLDVEVFPNPFDHSITLVGSKLEDVFLYDLQGKIIFQKVLFSQKKFVYQFENTLGQGMYLIKIKDNGRFYTKRLVKL